MSALPRLKGDGFQPIACGVCRRRATGLGYAPPIHRRTAPILWLCERPECAAVSAKVYSMSEPLLDAYEQRARDEAGQGAGEYLDELGVTDLEKLSKEQWDAFLDRVITGFEQSLRRQHTEGAAPF